MEIIVKPLDRHWIFPLGATSTTGVSYVLYHEPIFRQLQLKRLKLVIRFQKCLLGLIPLQACIVLVMRSWHKFNYISLYFRESFYSIGPRHNYLRYLQIIPCQCKTWFFFNTETPCVRNVEGAWYHMVISHNLFQCLWTQYWLLSGYCMWAKLDGLQNNFWRNTNVQWSTGWNRCFLVYCSLLTRSA